MTQSHWREYCRPIIAKVLAENKGKSEKDIRAALRAAYPFGERKYHPYKIWLSEISVQMGTKKKIFVPSKKRRRRSAPNLLKGDQLQLL